MRKKIKSTVGSAGEQISRPIICLKKTPFISTKPLRQPAISLTLHFTRNSSCIAMPILITRIGVTKGGALGEFFMTICGLVKIETKNFFFNFQRHVAKHSLRPTCRLSSEQNHSPLEKTK